MAPVPHDTFPLSSAQRGIWNAHLLTPESPYYVVGEVFKLTAHESDNTIDVDALVNSVAATVAESDTLRARITESGQDVGQYVSDEVLGIPVQNLEDAPDPEAVATALIDTRKAQLAQRWTTIVDQPLQYYEILVLSPEDVWIIQLYHHIIVDGYSAALLTKRISAHYAHVTGGGTLRPSRYASLQDIVRMDRDYIDSERYITDATYWKETLTPLPDTSNRESYVHGDASSAITTTVRVEPQEFETMSTLARKHGISWSELFLASYIAFLDHTLGSIPASHDEAERSGVEAMQSTEYEQILALPVMARPDSARLRTPSMQVNMLPLRVRYCAQDTILDIARTISHQLTGLREHQEFPGSDIAGVLNQPTASSLLHGIGVNAKVFDFGIHFPGLEAHLHNVAGGPPEDLVLVLTPDGYGGLECSFETDPESTPPALTRQRLHEIIALARAGCEDGTAATPAREQRVYSPEKVKEIQDNRASMSMVQDTPDLDQYIEALAGMDNIPLLTDCGGEHTLTAKQVFTEVSDRVRNYRRTAQVAPIILEQPKGIELALNIIAALYAHRPFVVIDPALPDQRRSMLRASIGDLSELAEDTAYILYTSGTTGIPKPVVIPRSALENLVAGHSMTLYPDAWSRAQGQLAVCHTAQFSFDAALDQLFWIFSGAHVHLTGAELLSNPDEFFRYIDEHAIDLVDTTPTYAQAVQQEFLTRMSSGRLSTLVLGGESVAQNLWNSLAQITKARTWNMYGPTEATVDALVAEVTPGVVTIGRPVPGMQAYLLDKHGRIVSDYEDGELYLAGPQLADGYASRAEETSEVFIEALENWDVPCGTRLYKTGDRARWIPYRGYQFLGRADRQFELRGHRVEAVEIELALTQIPGIIQAQAWMHGNALAVALVGKTDSDIREIIEGSLPTYMQPQWSIVVDTIPLTSNGKPDVTSLDAMLDREIARSQNSQTIASQPLTQQGVVIEDMLTQTLHIPHALWDTSFVGQGGDSISALKFMSALRRVGVEIPIQDILSNKTLREISSKNSGAYTSAEESYDMVHAGTAGNLTSSDHELSIPHLSFPDHLWEDIPVTYQLWHSSRDENVQADPPDSDRIQQALEYILYTVAELRTVIYPHHDSEKLDLFLPRVSAVPAKQLVEEYLADDPKVLSASSGRNCALVSSVKDSGEREVSLVLNSAVLASSRADAVVELFRDAYSAAVIPHESADSRAVFTAWKEGLESARAEQFPELIPAVPASDSFTPDAVLCLKQGSGRPVFALHGADGLGFVYASLASNLPSDRPLYALQFTHTDEVSAQRLVEEYCDTIYRIQKQDPYSIVGFSFGAAIAERVAARLEDDGQTVDSLVLIDGYPLGDRPPVAGALDEYSDRSAREVLESTSTEELGELLNVKPSVATHDEYGQYVVETTFLTARILAKSAGHIPEHHYSGPLTVVASSLDYKDRGVIHAWERYRGDRDFQVFTCALEHAEFVSPQGWDAMMERGLSKEWS